MDKDQNTNLNPAYSDLLELIIQIEQESKKYFERIDVNEAPLFSDNVQYAERYKKEFASFSVVLLHQISKCEAIVTSIAALIEKADQASDASQTELLINHFHRYLSFSENISDFIKQNEALLKKKDKINRSLVIFHAQKLLTSIKAYVEDIRSDI